MIFKFYISKKLLLTQIYNVGENLRKFIFYGFFSPKKTGSYVSIESDITQLNFYSDLCKYKVKDIRIDNYKIIIDSYKRLKIQYSINNKLYVMNSYIPFYGKTSKNKIFINNIKNIL